MFQHLFLLASLLKITIITILKDLAGQNQPLYDQMRRPMHTPLLPVFVLLVCLLVYGCTAEKAPAPDPGIPISACDTAVIKSAYVLTAIADNCTSRGCHKGTGSTASTDFTTYDKLKSYLSSNEALFKQRVTSAAADMPPGSKKLSQGMKDSIDCWLSHNMPQ